jgi:outer membrane lipoprotein SlyB
MKRFLFTVAALTIAVSSPVYAKGCIKGAIVGGVAGSAVGHGKLGAAAGCVVGHHEANKPDDTKAAPQAPNQPSK